MQSGKTRSLIVFFMFVVLTAAAAGCVGEEAPRAADAKEDSGTRENDAVSPAGQTRMIKEGTPARRELASGEFFFTSPDVASLEVTVPPNTTSVRVVLDYEMAHYAGLYLEGLPGCEVSKPDDARSLMGTKDDFDCDQVPPGSYTLTLRYDAGMGEGTMRVSGRVPTSA